MSILLMLRGHVITVLALFFTKCSQTYDQLASQITPIAKTFLEQSFRKDVEEKSSDLQLLRGKNYLFM